MSEDRPPFVPSSIPLDGIGRWLRQGWDTYRRTVGPSSGFAMLFAIIGIVGLYLLVKLGLTPMIYPWAGGFMLVGPALLCGYFELARRVDDGEPPHWSMLWRGFVNSPPGLWALGLLSAFLLMVWLTDAAIIYSLYFGREPIYLDWGVLSDPEMRDTLWIYFIFSTLVGSVLALIVFAITAFSVPLLYFHRLPLTVTIGRSVRIVFANLVTMVSWGVLLTVAIVGAILLFMPAFVVVFPVLAFASAAAYREACESPPIGTTRSTDN
jgi:uncharacterized membrane protein